MTGQQGGHTEGPWGPMGSPESQGDPWEPTQGIWEAAPGITIGSVHHTEPVCRVSGYLQPLLANARLIAAAPATAAKLAEVEAERQATAAKLVKKTIALEQWRDAAEQTTKERDLLTAKLAEVEADYAEMAKALALAAKELNAIRARSGAPVAIEWGPQGPIQSLLCTEEWWDELTEMCGAALSVHAANHAKVDKGAGS